MRSSTVGKMISAAVKPCLRALWRTAARPSGVVGPWLLAALRRFASCCRSDIILPPYPIVLAGSGYARELGSKSFRMCEKYFHKPIIKCAETNASINFSGGCPSEKLSFDCGARTGRARRAGVSRHHQRSGRRPAELADPQCEDRSGGNADRGQIPSRL